MSEFQGFIGGSYQHSSINVACQQSLNRFVEANTGTEPNKTILRARPGLKLFCTLPTFPVRGLWAGEDRLFAAGGSKLYEVFADGTSASPVTDNEIGDDDDHTPVQMFANGNQLFVVSAGKGFVANGTAMTQPPLQIGTYTDLAISAVNNTVISSVLTPFTEADVGTYLLITGGGTGFTLQLVKIIAFMPETDTTPPSAVLNVPAGLLGATGGTAEEYSGTEFLVAVTGAYLDGYFIAQQPKTGNYGIDGKIVRVSEPNNGLIWKADQFFVKDGYPDSVASIITDHEELYVMGRQTSEIYRDSGDINAPFVSDKGAFMHQGCVATWSLAQLPGGVYWLGGDARGALTAWQAQGFVPKPVSTPAIEQVWRTYVRTDDAIGYPVVIDRHSFWVLTFPTASLAEDDTPLGVTWVYDEATGFWHEWGSLEGTVGAEELHQFRGRCHAYTGLLAVGEGEKLQPRHFVGDRTTGKIYEMSFDFPDDDGTDIRYIRTTPHVAADNKRFFFSRLFLDREAGTAEDEPTFTLETSDDYGHTWSTPRTATGGATCAFLKRVQWWRLGCARGRVFRITQQGTDNGPWLGADITAKVGK